MKRDVVVYGEKFKKRAVLVSKNALSLTVLPFTNKETEYHEIELMERGIIERDGNRYEYAVAKFIMTCPENNESEV